LRTPELFRARFFGTALLRAKRAGLVRNACLVSARPETADAVREDLVSLLKQDPDAMVREHAAWALGRVGTPWARQALSAARSTDPAPGVVHEIEQSLAGTP
jgi:epoxyqueuosine reductase